MEKTKNVGLNVTTDADATTQSFKAWRDGLDGNKPGSNMVIIDDKLGDAVYISEDKSVEGLAVDVPITLKDNLGNSLSPRTKTNNVTNYEDKSIDTLLVEFKSATAIDAQTKANTAEANAKNWSVPLSSRGSANGVTPLNSEKKINAEFLPPMDYATNTEFDALEVVVAGKETPAGAQAKADAAKSGAIAASDTKGSANAVKTELEPKIALKAPIVSPALTGTPTVPTAEADTNSAQIANTAFVKAAIALLVDSSPDALNTLNELAEALGNDPNFATTMTNLIGEKAAKKIPLSSGNLATLDGAGNLADSGKKAADFAPVGAALPSKSLSATLIVAGWAGAGPFTQAVSVAGLTASGNGSVGIAQNASVSAREAAREGMLSITAQAAGSITITADGDKPSVDIPVTITVLG